MKTKTLLFILLVGAFLFCGSSNALAMLYSFDRITNNSGNAGALVESQLFVDVSPTTNSDEALFRVFNTGPESSVVHEVYFDDGTLLGISSLEELGNPAGGFTVGSNTYTNVGVDFQNISVSPGNLPSGNNINPPFLATAGFSVDVEKNPADGIGPGEYLGILFDLMSGKNINDVYDALADGSLRIGLHVGGIGTNGDSESYVNNGAVPIPAAGWLLGSGLIGYMAYRRRKKA